MQLNGVMLNGIATILLLADLLNISFKQNLVDLTYDLSNCYAAKSEESGFRKPAEVSRALKLSLSSSISPFTRR